MNTCPYDKNRIEIDLNKGDYSLSRISMNSLACCHEFDVQLQETQKNLKHPFFPHISVYGGARVSWEFELLGKSRPIAMPKVPPKELAALQEFVEYLHKLPEKKELQLDGTIFFREFKLPDPIMMPECWRITGRLWNRRLFILWGIEKRTTKGVAGTFQPLPKVAEGGTGGIFFGGGKAEHKSIEKQSSEVRLGVWRIGAIMSCFSSRMAGVLGRKSPKVRMVTECGDGITALRSTFGTTGTTEGFSGVCKDSSDSGDVTTPVSSETRFGRAGCLVWIFRMLILLLGLLLVGWLLHSCVPGCSGTRSLNPSVPESSTPSAVPPTSTGDDGKSGAEQGSPETGAPENGAQNPDKPTEAQTPEKPESGEPAAVPPTSAGDDGKKGETSTDGKGKNESGQSTPKPAPTPVKKVCQECGETIGKNGKCPNMCGKCGTRHRDLNGKCPVCDKQITEGMFLFRVSKPEVLSESGDIARVKFTVSPTENLSGHKYAVIDWTINDVVAKTGDVREFMPEGGLHYSRKYTIGADVEVGGRRQKVIPYQWNLVDEPAWQIVKDGQVDGFYKFKLICSNSSAVDYKATDWSVRYRKRDKYLDFKPTVQRRDDRSVNVSSKIDGYDTYYLELTASINGNLRGKPIAGKRTDIFEFMHGDSAQTLVKMKYEGALDKIFHCLARNNDGSMHNGTAFAISSKYLLTNYHVAVGSVEEQYGGSASRVKGLLKLSNETHRPFYAKVVGADRGRDIALLRICDKNGEETSEKFDKFFTLASSQLVRSIREGVNNTSRSVMAIGYPKGTAYNGKPAFTDGKAEMTKAIPINGVNCNVENVGHFTNIEPGYSGGPLIDMETGFILGVNRGGLMPVRAGHKPLKLATSVTEIRKTFKDIQNVGE